MTEPTPEDAARCIGLRKQCKHGQRLHPDDMAFVKRMCDEFPDWYTSTQTRVFNETAPFGAALESDDV